MKKNVRRKLLLTKGLLFLWICFSSLSVFAQNTQTVRGTVVDDKSEPLIGVSVVLRNTTNGTTTDFDGNFTLTVPAGRQTLVVSYLGMTTQDVVVTGTSPIRVVLREDSKMLREVVVVGFGTQKKESVVGAITQTTGRVLERAGGVSDLGQALTGNLPGVTTMSTTGMPGGEDPQIVIRGRSTWNGGEPLVLVDGIERPMNSVDINSVETISVLKDASATAVFGVRGANGVILITTKRGQEGKAQIDFNFSAAMKSPSRIPKKYDSYDALMYLNQAIENELALNPDSWGQIYPYDVIEKFRNRESEYVNEKGEYVDEFGNLMVERYPNIDWRKEAMKDFAMSYNANMSISGGTKYVKYFANVDYQREGDIYRTVDNNRGYDAGYGFDRLNVRSNLDFSLTPTTTLKVGLSGSHGIRKGPDSRVVNSYTAWTAVYNTAPDAMYPRYSDEHYPNGVWGYHNPDSKTGSNQNPLSTNSTRGIEYTTIDRINTDFTLIQDLGKLLKGLSANVKLAYDNQYQEIERGVNDMWVSDYEMKYIWAKTGEVNLERFYTPDINGFGFQESVGWNSRGGRIDENSVFRKLYYSAQLDYANTFANKHNVTLMGNFSRQEHTTGSFNPYHREDWVFRVTYDFARRYLIEYNGSYNGSDIFSRENRFVFFQSGALGWNVSEEPFIKNLKLNWLDMFKLRASYGKIGDDQIPSVRDRNRFPYMTSWQMRSFGFRQTIWAENTGTSPYDLYYEATVGNYDLQWETIEKFNFGIDYSFLNSLISGNVDIFKDKRRNVFVYGNDRAVPSYFGAAAPNANLGATDVGGLEVELRFNKSINKNLRLWSNWAYTYAKDKVLERDDPELLPDYRKQAGYAIGQGKYYVNTGYINNWDEYYGSTAHDASDGARTPGSYIILDYDADGVISQDDRIPYSFSRIPQNTFNATFGVDYKGWNFFIQFYGVNNVIRDISYISLENKTRHTVYEYQGSYWSKDNMNADSPKLVYQATQSGYAESTRYCFDASYLRLKNIELGYTFTDAHKWMHSAGIKSLKLFVNGNNLWLLSKMPDDRETNGDTPTHQGAYPTMKRVNFGLRLSL
ncbi:MAG: TonB-dependent receptor [Dysgonamonadaceae bacterium]|jgi:TonB-linked SusC/RagA family outer membrane protein|nr:TonB-dependent receptor [Dysgonamonadaceae bacterium]